MTGVGAEAERVRLLLKAYTSHITTWLKSQPTLLLIYLGNVVRVQALELLTHMRASD